MPSLMRSNHSDRFVNEKKNKKQNWFQNESASSFNASQWKYRSNKTSQLKSATKQASVTSNVHDKEFQFEWEWLRKYKRQTRQFITKLSATRIILIHTIIQKNETKSKTAKVLQKVTQCHLTVLSLSTSSSLSLCWPCHQSNDILFLFCMLVNVKHDGLRPTSVFIYLFSLS